MTTRSNRTDLGTPFDEATSVTQAARRSRAAHRAVLAALALAASLLSSAASAAATPEGKVLVHGEADGAIFDQLVARLDATRSSRGTDPADFGAVIVDGDHFGPEEIAADPLLRRAFATDRWIVGLDLTEAHKSQGLAALTGSSNGSGSRAYLVRQITEERGDTSSWVVELARDESATDVFNRFRWGALTDDPSDLPKPPDPAAVADQIVDFLLGRAELPEIVEDQPIPPGLISKKYIFSLNASRELPKPAKSGGSQTTNVTWSAVYRIFLDNNENPQGDFQFIAFSVDGLANPKGGARDIAADRERERAWMQALISTGISLLDDVPLEFVATAPANRNGETNYTTDASFTVDYSLSGGASSSFKWGTSQSYTIRDWEAVSNSSGIVGQWEFASAHPGKGRADNYATCGAGWLRVCFLQTGLPNKPNALNKEAVAFHAEEVWRTTEAVDRIVRFQFNGFQRLADAFCGHYSPGACWGGEQVKVTALPWAETHSINLGAVIPVPIRSLTFAPNPVDAGTSATGRIELATPAPTNVVVELSSSSGNATVLPTVIVPQGETSATFEVKTNANGLSRGQSTVATITAFYATNAQAQLTVRVPG